MRFLRRFSGLSDKGARKVLDKYADKITHKAKSANINVNELIRRECPRDEVGKVRKVNDKVNSWRANHGRKAGTSVFIRVPWMNKDKAESPESSAESVEPSK